MKSNLVVRQKIGFPKGYPVDKATWDKLGAEIRDAVIENIKTQKQVDGSRIKMNPPSSKDRRSWRDIKRLRGGDSRSLIAFAKQFIDKKSWEWKATKTKVEVMLRDVKKKRWKGGSIIDGKSSIREASKGLQEKLGYVGWMGTSPAQYQKIVKKVLLPRIREISEKVHKRK